MTYLVYSNELYHHGVVGMHWGVRRYQNADGTRTALGKRRMRTDKKPITRKEKALYQSASKAIAHRRQEAEDWYNTCVASKNRFEKNIADPGTREKLLKAKINEAIQSDYENPQKYANDWLRNAPESYAKDVRNAKENLNKWDKVANKYAKTPVEDFTDDDFAEAKAIAKLERIYRGTKLINMPPDKFLSRAQAGKTGSKLDNAFKPTIKVKDQAPISPAEKAAKDVSKISTNVANISRVSKKTRKQPNNPAKEMSDEELTRRIRRLQLEKQYKDLSETDVHQGKMTVEDYASIATSVAVIAGSVASIYTLFKNL